MLTVITNWILPKQFQQLFFNARTLNVWPNKICKLDIQQANSDTQPPYNRSTLY